MMDDHEEVSPHAGESRREAVKKLAYAAPVVLSLAVSPSFAAAGSGRLSHGQSGPGPDGRRALNN